MDVICIEEYAGKEIFDAFDMFFDFLLSKDSVSALLGSADITMLITRAMNTGGYAWIGSPSRPGGIVPKYMAEEWFNFGHEVGHILGGHHNWYAKKSNPCANIKAFSFLEFFQGAAPKRWLFVCSLAWLPFRKPNFWKP